MNSRWTSIPGVLYSGNMPTKKGRTSLHARYMRHLLPLTLPLKGRTSLPMRDMCHLPLPIWEVPTFHVKRIPFISDKRRSLQKIRYALETEISRFWRERKDLTLASEKRWGRPSPAAFLAVCFASCHIQVRSGDSVTQKILETTH